MLIGTVEILEIAVGEQSISEVYFGEILIWENLPQLPLLFGHVIHTGDFYFVEQIE